MQRRLYFHLPAGETGQEILHRLQQEFSVVRAEAGRSLVQYYDTFDWRLHQAGLILNWDSNQMRLFQTDPPYSEYICSLAQELKFIKDFPAGVLKDKLHPITDVRALLPLFAIKKNVLKIKFLDHHQKTVCFGFYEKNSIHRDGVHRRLKPVLCILPLKGYSKFAEKMITTLAAMKFQAVETDLYYLACQKLHINPGSYSSKLQVQIDRKMGVQQAEKLILQQLLSTLEINENGIILDTDTEFLHDYRVAVRRIRSLFGQLRDHFPAGICARARKDFPPLIQLSNKRRDIDVFIHHQNEYRALLPPRYRRTVLPLFEYLGQQRLKEHKKILRYLHSDGYKELKYFWNNFCSNFSPLKSPAPVRMALVQNVADQNIQKRYNKILKFKKSITAGISDEFLHRIRIECKKLRYALEFFLSLSDQTAVRSILKKLRLLQDTLGEYHDWCIQQKRLLVYLKQISAREQNMKSMIGAVNGLVFKLQEKKKHLHVTFREQFADLCHPDLQKMIRVLFTR